MKAEFLKIALSFEAQIAINYLVPGLIPAHTSTCPSQVGNVSSLCRDDPGDRPIPSQPWRGVHNFLPSHFIVPDGEEKRFLWQLIKWQDFFFPVSCALFPAWEISLLSTAILAGATFASEKLDYKAVWLWVCNTLHTLTAFPDPTHRLAFYTGPPLPGHINDSFILILISETWGWAQHITQQGTVSAPGFGWTASPGASVTQRCHKQGQHSRDHTRMSKNAYKKEGGEMMLNDLQGVKRNGETVKSKR